MRLNSLENSTLSPDVIFLFPRLAETACGKRYGFWDVVGKNREHIVHKTEEVPRRVAVGLEARRREWQADFIKNDNAERIFGQFMRFFIFIIVPLQSFFNRCFYIIFLDERNYEDPSIG